MANFDKTWVMKNKTSQGNKTISELPIMLCARGLSLIMKVNFDLGQRITALVSDSPSLNFSRLYVGLENGGVHMLNIMQHSER